MKVILLQDVKGVGRRGDERNVTVGYANNFLIPQKLVAPLTQQLQSNIQDAEAKKIRREEQKTMQQNKCIKEIKGKLFTLNAKSNEQGRLFKAVSGDDIKECMYTIGIELPDHAKIVFKKPIKTKGMHIVEIILKKGISVSIKVEIK